MTTVNPSAPAPDVSSAEAFLQNRAPEVWKQVEAPEVDEEDAGIALGGEQSRTEWRSAARKLKAALDLQLAEVDKSLAGFRRRLITARRVRLVAEIIAVIGPASIWGVLKKDTPATAEYLSAGFTLVGLIVAVIAAFSATNPFTNQSLLDGYKSLAEWRGSASSVVLEIDVNYSRKSIGPEQENLLKQAIDLCKQYGGMLKQA